MRIKLAFIILALLGNAFFAFAGTTGKIAGGVTDAETGQPLPGVNIMVEGTAIGAASDLSGNYTILNVRPGTYDLSASMIGYTRITVKGIRVNIDQTTTVNFVLKSEVLPGEVVTVVAERPLVEPDVAASKQIITSGQFEQLPVANITDVLSYQAGITSDLSIRGGRPDQAIFVVDGTVMRDERTNKPITTLPLSAVQEVAVQTGGFSAEYNDVRSGVVNLVIKEGSPQRYSGTVSLRYSPPAAKHFGISPFDPNSFWLRPYLDPAVCWTGTNNGAWDSYTQRQYPRFDGWNAVAKATVEDNDPTNDLTPAAAQQIYRWQHRKEGDISKPDQTIDLGFGGPVPVIGKYLGQLRFFASYRRFQDMYLMQLSRDGVYDQSTMLKLTADLTPTTKLSLLGLYGELEASTFSTSGGTDYIQDTWDVASTIDRAGFTIPWRIYTNLYWCPTSIFYNTLAAKVTHVVSPLTFVEFQLKRTGKEYHTSHERYRDLTKKYEIFPGYFADEAPFGFLDKPVFGIDGLCMGGPVSVSRDFSEFASYSARFDLTSQVSQRNQVKTGFEFIYDDFNLKFGMENRALPAGNWWNTSSQRPFRGSIYLQDKIEYKGFIATVGLLASYVNPNGNWYNVDVYSRDFFSNSFDPGKEDIFKSQPAKSQWFLSPRVGVSHPITVNSKLYFNYGHYRQLPTSESLYRVQRTATNKLDYLGDPTLPLARTVAYELGYDHSLFDAYLLQISAYYRNIDNQEDWTRYISTDGKVNYLQLTANSYEDIRGFEINVSKMIGTWVTGNANYEYRVGTSGYFGVKSYYENPSDQREFLRQNPYQEKPVPRPRAKGYLDFHTPEALGPKVGEQHPLGGWHFNFVGLWTAGYWFTWNPNNIPGLKYNVQWKDFLNLDLKISKTLAFDKFQVKLFADIFNLFNLKYLSGESFYDADDYNYYMYSLHLPKDQAAALGSQQSPYPNIPGNDRPGDYRPTGVAFVPIEYRGRIDFANDRGSNGVIYYNAEDARYWKFANGQWLLEDKNRIDKVLQDKAYIDMPNQTFFSFLNPRDIFLGVMISFDLK
ncbi:MAG: TonB-dependent receptor [candidate division KSB1 bacterium]|nr:TonB-dependent receptor [candidate division KSB1 bacterium]MDZ7342162.1 TonB-dependent receptor [candidate division KSB1 bacterium]